MSPQQQQQHMKHEARGLLFERTSRFRCISARFSQPTIFSLSAAAVLCWFTRVRRAHLLLLLLRSASLIARSSSSSSSSSSSFVQLAVVLRAFNLSLLFLELGNFWLGQQQQQQLAAADARATERKREFYSSSSFKFVVVVVCCCCFCCVFVLESRALEEKISIVTDAKP